MVSAIATPVDVRAAAIQRLWDEAKGSEARRAFVAIGSRLNCVAGPRLDHLSGEPVAWQPAEMNDGLLSSRRRHDRWWSRGAAPDRKNGEWAQKAGRPVAYAAPALHTSAVA